MSEKNPYNKMYRIWLQGLARQRLIQQKKQNKNIEKHIRWMVLVFFIGVFIIAHYGPLTLTSWNTMALIYLIIVLILNFLPNHWLTLAYQLNKELKVLMVFFALAPMATGLALGLNFTFTSQPISQCYKVIDSRIYFESGTLEVFLEEPNNIMHLNLRRFSTENLEFMPDSIAYEIHQGCLGLEVVKKITPLRINY